MFLTRLRPVGSLLLVLLSYLSVALASGDSVGQVRRKVEPAPPEVLPTIADDSGRCSFAYHDALGRLPSEPLAMFDKQARVTEPGVTGRWLFWVKGGRSAQKTPTPERVCAESVTRAGRARCLRWELKPVDPALAALTAAQPTADELALLKALDGYVIEKGAPLEFGSNGRQFATLQRVALELGNYSAQASHPALCNGVPEMMEFQADKLAGLKKRSDDIAVQGAKAILLAQKRVTAALAVRASEAQAAAAVTATDGAAASTSAAVRQVPSIAVKQTDPAALLLVLFDGLLTPEQRAGLAQDGNAIEMLRRARELLGRTDGLSATPAVRASTGAALRMIEAASYSQKQVARVTVFNGLFFGTIDQILSAHKKHCTCGD